MLAALLQSLGFDLVATTGTARALQRIGIPVETVQKVTEGSPNVVDLIRDGAINLIINSPLGRGARTDGYEIREAAIRTPDPLHHHPRGRLRRRAGDRSGPRGCAGGAAGRCTQRGVESHAAG